MSEIVFTDTIENRAGIDTMDGGRMLADTKFSIFRGDGKVAFVTSRLVVGVPRERAADGYGLRPNIGKRYYYWRSVDSYGFRRNKAGYVQPYECQRPWDAAVGIHWRHRQPRAPFQMLDPHEAAMGFKAAEAFQWHVWSEFGIKEARDLWPLMDTYGLIHPWTIPNSLKSGFRSDDVTAMARYAFGKNRATRDMVKAIADTDPYIVAYAQQFRGLVPDASLLTFLKDNHFDSEMEEDFVPHSPDFRKALRMHPGVAAPLIDIRLDKDDLHKIRRLVALNSAPTYFRMAESRGIKTWKDLVY